jgi:hypothetical protein
MTIAIPNTYPNDPSEIGWPINLPLELAMRGSTPVKDICFSYGLGKADWDRLKEDPNFIQALTEAEAMMAQEGAMFKAKLRAQAEGMLARNWQLVHSNTEAVPANVQADLFKFTVRAAGLDASIEQKAKAAGQGAVSNALQINLILGD